MKEGFSDECAFACAFAESMLTKVCKDLDSGKITVSDLETVISHKEQLKRLCAASKDSQVQHVDVDTAVKIRVDELKRLRLHRDCLLSLRNELPPNIRGKTESFFFIGVYICLQLLCCNSSRISAD